MTMNKALLAAAAVLLAAAPARAMEIAPQVQTRMDLGAARDRALENRVRREIFQSEQQRNRREERRDSPRVETPDVPEFVPTCRLPLNGVAVPVRCR